MTIPQYGIHSRPTHPTEGRGNQGGNQRPAFDEVRPLPKGAKILMITTGLNPGGAERQVVELATRYLQKGLQPAVMSLVSNGTVLKRKLKEHGVPLLELNMKPGRPSLLAFVRAVLWVRRFEPMVVHSHMFHANLLARLMRVFLRRFLLVCTAHNSNEGGRLNMALYRATNFLATITTNVSTLAARELERRGAAAAGSICSVPNGIDTELFRPDHIARKKLRSQLALADDCFTFLAAGRLVAQKDYKNLLDATRQLIRTTPSIRLLIAGSGEDGPSLRRICTNYGLDSHVYWLGEREDIHLLMNAADTFVLSSEYEGFGLVVAEAMATGIPVITTTSKGPEEVAGDTAILVPIKNPEALSVAMLRVQTLSSSERQEMLNRSRQRVLENFSLNAAVDRWLLIYSLLLKGL